MPLSCQETELITTNKIRFIVTGLLYGHRILNEPLEYFYCSTKNSPLFFILHFTWVIAIFLPHHFLMHHPLLHNKDKAGRRVFTPVTRPRHPPVSIPPRSAASLRRSILNLPLFYSGDRREIKSLFAFGFCMFV